MRFFDDLLVDFDIIILMSLLTLGACGEKKDTLFVESCTIAETIEGIQLSCPDGTSTLIPFPEDGKDGSDGTDGTIVETIPLCPDLPGNYPEILIRIDDKLYALFDHPSGERLVEVVPGNYHTTDGRNCHFTITNELEVSYE